MKITIYDISEKAGVSIATVSRVLNGSPRVSEKTKRRVLSVMEECGYTPNAFARGLGLNTMKTVGILCADSSDIYLAKAVYHLEALLRENGYHSILCCTGYHTDRKKSCMELLLTRKVDAIILTGSNFVAADESQNLYIRDAAAKVPVMLLNAEYDCPNVYSTLCDDYQSIRNVTLSMIESGCRFPFYFYNSTSYSGRQKLAGFRHAVKEKQSLLLGHSELYYDGAHDELEKTIDFLDTAGTELKKADGVITSEDNLAIAILKYAKKNSLRIPEDLKVTGYNNSLLATCCEPELSSVDNHLENLCSNLVKTLLEVMEGNQVPPKSVFYGSFVERSSFSPSVPF